MSVDAGLDITRTLHKGFRLGKLLTHLPLTRVLLDRDTMAREVGGFWRRRPPVSFYFLEQALAFCAYLLERVRAGDLEVRYLEEIAALSRGEVPAAATRRCRLFGTRDDGRLEWHLVLPAEPQKRV